MSHPYDAGTKHLVEAYPADWLALSGRPADGPVEVIDADLSTVTAAADKVLRVGGPSGWLYHVELQSSRDPSLPGRVPLYNAGLEHRHGLPVWSLVVLLRPKADLPGLTGFSERRLPGDETPYRTLRYGVVRVWQLPAATFLEGGLGLLPLAPLADVTEADLPGIIGRMESRVAEEAAPGSAGDLWTAASVLMGLRYAKDLIVRLLQGVHGMEESTYYQHILAKGGVKEAQKMLLRLARKRFRQLPVGAETAVAAITDVDRLEALADRLLDVSTWDELLSTPAAG